MDRNQKVERNQKPKWSMTAAFRACAHITLLTPPTYTSPLITALFTQNKSTKSTTRQRAEAICTHCCANHTAAQVLRQ